MITLITINTIITIYFLLKFKRLGWNVGKLSIIQSVISFFSVAISFFSSIYLVMFILIELGIIIITYLP